MKRLLIFTSCLALTLPLFSWETSLFRTKVPKNLNVKPLKQEPQKKSFMDKHFFSASFLKIYVDQALMVLKYPTHNQHDLELDESGLVAQMPLDFTQNVYEARALIQELSAFFDFDFDFGYTGISITESMMPHELNYSALEDAILTGFEASETVVSYYKLHPNWAVFGHVSLMEKFTSEKQQVSTLDTAIATMENQINSPYSRTYYQTVKYGMGLRWKKNIQGDSKITIDAVMLQKADGHWTIDEMLLQDYVYNGVQFDSWKFSVNFQF